MTDKNSYAVDRQVRVVREFPPDLTSHFVQHFVVQFREDHFVLSFFEIWPPIIVGETEEEVVRQLSDLAAVPAKCVARLVITPSKMEELIGIMTDNYERFRHQQQLLVEE